jgi:hypothetical protein
MKDVVDLDVEVPQERLSELMADPARTAEWMDDVERCEAVAGVPGTPGSQYRLVPRKGSMVFVATVLSRDVPNELRLALESPQASVKVTSRFVPLSADRTRLISEEVFTFRGVFKIVGLFTRPAIHKAHRHHIEAFKRFAERER